METPQIVEEDKKSKNKEKGDMAENSFKEFLNSLEIRFII